MKELRLHGDVIVIGRGSLEYLKKIDSKRAFLVTGGSSMIKNGTIDKIKGILQEKACEVYVYSGIRQNPSTRVVLDGLEAMKEFKPDMVIGLGGGSPIDAAKVMALFFDYPQLNFDDAVEGRLPAKRKSIKFIAIPGTSGTATEVTNTSVITFKERDIKIGLKTPAFLPDVAILDADITMSMPDNVVAETGMDAMTHAVECYINKNLDDFTECIASGAVEGLFKYLPVSYIAKDVKSREKVHNYQSIAGLAFDNVGLGASHGISHAIGAHFDKGHGLINAVALPYVLQYNSKDNVVRDRLKYLAKRIGEDDFIEAIKGLNRTLNIPRTFNEMGIPEAEFKKNFDLLVTNSLKNSTVRNPVPISKDEMSMLLKCIYEGRDVE